MASFTTIATYSTSSELSVIRSRLQAEGIYCHVPYENRLYSKYNTGPLELQVRSVEAAKARSIMREAGYRVIEEPVAGPPSAFWAGFIHFTGQVPILKNQLPIARFMILAGLLAAAAVVVLMSYMQ